MTGRDPASTGGVRTSCPVDTLGMRSNAFSPSAKFVAGAEILPLLGSCLVPERLPSVSWDVLWAPLPLLHKSHHHHCLPSVLLNGFLSWRAWYTARTFPCSREDHTIGSSYHSQAVWDLVPHNLIPWPGKSSSVIASKAFRALSKSRSMHPTPC